MARLVGVRQIWTFLGLWGGAIVALGVGTGVSRTMQDIEGTTAGYRALAATVGTLAIVPCVVLMVWLYRRSDEYERHAMLVTMAVAFGLAAVGIALVDNLEASGFIEWGALGPRWWLIPVCWVLAAGVVRVLGPRNQ